MNFKINDTEKMLIKRSNKETHNQQHLPVTFTTKRKVKSNTSLKTYDYEKMTCLLFLYRNTPRHQIIIIIWRMKWTFLVRSARNTENPVRSPWWNSFWESWWTWWWWMRMWWGIIYYGIWDGDRSWIELKGTEMQTIKSKNHRFLCRDDFHFW